MKDSLLKRSICHKTLTWFLVVIFQVTIITSDLHEKSFLYEWCPFLSNPNNNNKIRKNYCFVIILQPDSTATFILLFPKCLFSYQHFLRAYVIPNLSLQLSLCSCPFVDFCSFLLDPIYGIKYQSNHKNTH